MIKSKRNTPAIGVIPARYGSKRLLSKPLKEICGKTLLERVFIRAKEALTLSRLVIATDDNRIVTAATKFNAEVMLTSRKHESGTDRVAEVARRLRIPSESIVVNIQGDAPMLHPAMIDDIVQPLLDDNSIAVAALYYRIKDEREISDPNVVKVVVDREGNALYFSRLPVPYSRDNRKGVYYKHIGPYAYRRSFLDRFSRLKPSNLEKMERLEQLRVLENGYRIKMIETVYDCPEVDTQSDIYRIEKMLRKRRRT